MGADGEPGAGCQRGSQRRGVPGSAPSPKRIGGSVHGDVLSELKLSCSLPPRRNASESQGTGGSRCRGRKYGNFWIAKGGSSDLPRSGRAGRRGSRGGDGLRSLSRVPWGVMPVPSRAVPVPGSGVGVWELASQCCPHSQQVQDICSKVW